MEDPCSVCQLNVGDRPALLCPYCNLWSHSKCNKIKSKEYKVHQNNPDEPFCCQKCLENIPFNNLNSNEFETFAKFDVLETQNGANIRLTPTPSQLKIIQRLKNLIHQKDSIPSHDDDTDEYSAIPENDFDQPISCTYYSCEDFVNAKLEAHKNFSILHLNIHSITLHIEELRILLHALDYHFDIIAISESKLKDEPKVNINLPGYHAPHCKYTEAEKGGTILYVSDKLNFKPRKDLEIYEKKRLESCFVEVINKKSANDIIGVIYRHPKMDTNSFTDDKLTKILNIISREKNKKLYIAGDFNFDLLKYSSHSATADFYDKMSSNLLVPLISVPTKINTKNDTLIDNIFTNQLNSETLAGNLTVNFSDGHLPSFAIFPKPNQNHLPKKHNLYTRGKFDDQDKNESIRIDFAATDFDTEVIVQNDAEKSLNNLLRVADRIIDNYYPLHKLTRKEFKQTLKPWITNGIICSIKRKDELFYKYMKCKNIVNKTNIHNEYKALKNRITSLIHISKKNYYTKYFEQHSKNIKKIWAGIKGIINIKTKDQNSPNCIEVSKELVTDSAEIPNKFNDYFSSVADKILEKNKTPTLNTFDKYLGDSNPNSFVFKPSTPNDVFLIISGLNQIRAQAQTEFPQNFSKC